MPRVVLQALERLVGKALDVGWQRPIRRPEVD
jgi:hypothetical protein